MPTAIVIEAQLQLEAVTADPFIVGLDGSMHDAVERLARRVAAAPRRRIYD